LRDADEFSADERALDSFTGIGERRYFDYDLVAEADARAWDGQAPINAFYRHVFSNGPDIDRVTLCLQRTDPLQRINANGAIGTTVVLYVGLTVSFEP